MISGWFATREFVAKSPDLVKKFQTAMSETSRWANDHHAESGTILAKYTKMDVDIIHGMGRCPFADQLRAADIQPQLDVAAKFAIIPKPMSANDLLVTKAARPQANNGFAEGESLWMRLPFR